MPLLHPHPQPEPHFEFVENRSGGKTKLGATWLVGTRENIEVYQCFIKVQSITTQFSLNTNKYSRPHQHSINQISTIGQILGFFSTESQLREHRCNSLWCFWLVQHPEIMDWILMLIKNRDSIGALHNLDILYLGLQYGANIDRTLRYSSMYSV